LVQPLLFRRFDGRETVGQVKRAEFDGKAPMQNVDVAREHRPKLAAQRIDAEIDRIAGHRVLERDRAGNTERPQPSKTIGEITEALAEEDARQDRVGAIGGDTLRARMPNAPRTFRRYPRLIEVIPDTPALYSK